MQNENSERLEVQEIFNVLEDEGGHGSKGTGPQSYKGKELNSANNLNEAGNGVFLWAFR